MKDIFKEQKELEPDKDWVLRTRQNLVSLSSASGSTKGNYLFFITNLMSTNLRFAFSFLLAAIVLAASFATYQLLNERETTNQEVIYLSDADAEIIFEEVLNNNSDTVLSGAANQFANLTASTAESADQRVAETLPAILPVENLDYNYTEFSLRTEIGPAIEKCESYSFNYSSSFFSRSYFSGGESFNESISNYSDGELESYYLSVFTPNESYSYEYLGGEYAVRLNFSDNYFQNFITTELENSEVEVFEELGTMETEFVEPQVPENLPVLEQIKQLYGEDVRVKQVGDNYIVEYSFETNCNYDELAYIQVRPTVFPQSDLEDTIVYELYLNNDFEVERTIEYLESISEDNILIETETSFVRSMLENPVSRFQFPFEVEVREIEVGGGAYDFEEELQKIENFLTNTDFKFVGLANSEFSLNYFYASEAQETEEIYSYYSDRSFYSDSKRGEERYRLSNEVSQSDFVSSIVNYSYITQNYENYIDFSVYSANFTKEEILNNWYYDPEFSTIVESQVELTVDGAIVSATVYKVTTNYPQAEPLTDDLARTGELEIMPVEPCFEGNCIDNEFKTEHIYFEYDNLAYFVTSSGSDTNLSNSLSLFMIDESSEVQEIIDELRQNQIRAF